MERPFSSQRRDFLALRIGTFQSLLAPDAQYPLAVQFPARAFKQGGDALVAIAGVLEGKHPDLGGEVVLFRIGFWDVALGAAGLAQHPAGPSFGDLEDRPDVIDAAVASLRAYQFPEAASFRIWMSRAWSATTFFKRVFSSRRRLASLASAIVIPP